MSWWYFDASYFRRDGWPFWQRWTWQLNQDDGRPMMFNGHTLTLRGARRAALRAWRKM